MDSFHSFNLFDRILAAINDLKWRAPTEIQTAVIPLILEGKNILACGRTGCGKTGSFVIPIIQNILAVKEVSELQQTRALILAPTKELCSQIEKNFRELSAYCMKSVKCLNVTNHSNLTVLKPFLQDAPDILIGTPTSVCGLVSQKSVDLSSVKFVVVDEADLISSFGYAQEISTLTSSLSEDLQAVLLSATLGKDVKALQKSILKKKSKWCRVELTGESSLPSSSQLTQYVVSCEEEDKFVLIYSLLKLKLIRGKTLVFVNTVDRGYRLKLFLEQFAIRSAILNSELPTSSRLHVVQQFNKGLYDIVIASDESFADEPVVSKGKTKRRKDKEFGVSRGIDFQLVSNVINFDFPTSYKSYLHRVGRTSRADQKGTALSFVSTQESSVLKEVEAGLSETEGSTQTLRPYQFRMSELDGFRYRARDAMRAVTSAAVREARLLEIKQEMLHSSKLKAYFQDNPQDLTVLRHDKTLHTAKVQGHLRHVPEYIVPTTLREMMPGRAKRRRPMRSFTDDQRRRKRKAGDPLFSAQAALQLGSKSKRRKH